MLGVLLAASTLTASIWINPLTFTVDHPPILTVGLRDRSADHTFVFGLGGCMFQLTVVSLDDGSQTHPTMCTDIYSLASRDVLANEFSEVRIQLLASVFPKPGTYHVRVIGAEEMIGPLRKSHTAPVSSNEVEVTVLPSSTATP